jgi:uncharacterized coiled-coil protein SlyX
VLNSELAVETNVAIMRAFVASRKMIAQLSINVKVQQLAADIESIKTEINDILADQNDINESTRAQLDAISTALAELQSSRSQNATLKPRKPIGFIQPKDEDNV